MSQMQIMITRGNSYMTDESKINPENLSEEQNSQYMGLVLKTKLIEKLNGKASKKLIDEAISSINLAPFTRVDISKRNYHRLNDDERLLLDNLIRYQLFLRGVDIKDVNLKDVLSRF